MKDWYYKRTKKHIDLVKKYCQKIYGLDPVKYEDLLNRAKEHDLSKYSEEELKPYILLTWNYYADKHNLDFKLTSEMEKKTREAWFHHYTVNKHHPEYYKNIEDMPDIDIAEMVADWCSVSEEMGNNPIEWAKGKIGSKFKFNEYQVKLIYELLNNIWSK